MAVYFVYRDWSAPSEKRVRRFEHETVLAWGKATWAEFEDYDEAHEYAEKALGVRMLGGFFYNDGSREFPPKPRSMAGVVAWLGDYSEPLQPVHRESNGPHHVQLYIDQDDWHAAVYLFDDHYCTNHPGKADFLLIDGWELPGGDSDGPVPELPITELREREKGGEGTVYVVGLATAAKLQANYQLDALMCADRVEGIRLPDLVRHVLLTSHYSDFLSYGYDFPLRVLRDKLQRALKAPKGEDAGFLKAIRKQPQELTHWGAYSDWLQDRDLPPAGVHLLDRGLRGKERADLSAHDNVKVTPHMAQICMFLRHYHVAPEYKAGGWGNEYCQCIFFDDRWAAAHPTLAAGILTFASRWDVLT